MSINSCQLIKLQTITDTRGNLSFIESKNPIPFKIERVFYIYDIPGGSCRGSHAHRTLHQFVVSVSGSFEVLLDDGNEKRKFFLNKANEGLYISPMIWSCLDNFSSGAVCVVLASAQFSEADYIREYSRFLCEAMNGDRLRMANKTLDAFQP
jgi:hypothetical protein